MQIFSEVLLIGTELISSTDFWGLELHTVPFKRNFYNSCSVIVRLRISCTTNKKAANSKIPSTSDHHRLQKGNMQPIQRTPSLQLAPATAMHYKQVETAENR